jgi:hypothetical protein
MFSLRVFLASVLFLCSLALLYLGDNWLSSILASSFIGMAVCLAHWIYFRRHRGHRHAPLLSSIVLALVCSLLIVTTSILWPVSWKKQLRLHSHYLQQFVLTHKAWWNQKRPLLPVYTTNRIGNRIGLFNIQYFGSLEKLKTTLSNHGWKLQPDSLFYSLLMRASGQNSAQELPLMAQLYLNKKPALIMTYPSGKNQTQFVLRLWRSNYHLRSYRQPIWLGSIIMLQTSENQTGKPDLFSNILPALDAFNTNSINLPADKQIRSTHAPTQPRLLMIEDQDLMRSAVSQ